MKEPDAPERLTAEIVAFIQRLRGEDLFKVPGVAETLDWTRALAQLGIVSLEPRVVSDTLGAILKYQDDVAKVSGGPAARIVDEIQSQIRAAAGR